MQQLEIGKIYNGKVKGITQYGAFVDIDGGGTGMVHISEIANTFVNEIRDHLTENQEVKVKVIGINEAGKVSLSIKKAVENTQAAPAAPKQHQKRSGDGGQNRSRANVWEPKKQQPLSEMSFEDMMAKFKQDSEEKMSALKKSSDSRYSVSRRGNSNKG